MSSSALDPYAVDVRVSEQHLTVSLRDGRRISVPLEWFPRLRDATAAEREEWELIGSGSGIYWPLIDEDLSIAGLLRAS